MSRSRSALGALLLAAVLAGPPAAAQQPPSQQPGRGGEQLYLIPPKDWTVAFHKSQGSVDLTELVPPGQSGQEWTDMLAVQMVTGKVGSPQDLLKEQLTELDRACEKVGAGGITPGMENGYETALRVVACSRSKRWGKGEINLYKVIRGRDRTYMISRSWRGAPFDSEHLPLGPEVTAQWLAFMQKVVLCDSRAASLHPCPRPGSQGPAPGQPQGQAPGQQGQGTAPAPQPSPAPSPGQPPAQGQPMAPPR